ncbi:MAG: EAL domain-containing protein [Actinomycetota bacterium]|nr:EAL domain-containing protein [Actinomycetota bacterium]
MDRSEKLAHVLAEFAHTLGRGFRIQEILDHLVGRIVDVLPVTGAGVMLMGPADELHFVAASDAAILEIEALQNELAEGPCLEAYRFGEAVAVPDLDVDQRFPRFSERAREAGLAAVFTFPMSLDGHRFGALDLYRDRAGGLDAAEMAAAQVLTDVAAAYIRNAWDRAEVADTLDLARQRSLHDPLTGLPNRTLLKERLEQAVARAGRSHKLVAVLFVDLDRFKVVNDHYGHFIGDGLLVAVAGRLGKVLRAGDTLARLAGDEFVIICEDLEHAELAERVAARIATALGPAFELEGEKVKVTASTGIAFAGPGEEMPDTLLRDADFAMYQAKQAGGAHHQVIGPASRVASERRARLTRDLRDALGRRELRLAYQPLVDVRDGRLTGVEALLRWEHPTRGWVMPHEILPIAEPTGLILKIGEWVMTQACRDLQHWQQHYGAIPHVTVNVSPYQVMAPGFDLTVERVLEKTGVDPVKVFLEVTESAFLEDGPRALSVLQQTKNLGVGLILDDFGTGYSSLNYLRRFPFDVLKIDQIFMSNLDSDNSTRKIVASIVELAHGLGLTVVAEGIETERQRTQLVELGTDRAQGFYFCRPLFRDQIDQRVLGPAGRAPVLLPLPGRH